MWSVGWKSGAATQRSVGQVTRTRYYEPIASLATEGDYSVANDLAAKLKLLYTQTNRRGAFSCITWGGEVIDKSMLVLRIT